MPVTPAGKPLKVAPVAPVVAYVIVLIGELTHLVWLLEPAGEVNVIVLAGVTIIEPMEVIVPQPPVKVTMKLKTPDTVGVPLIVTTLDAQLPVTPVGKPLKVAPVAPVVAYVIFVIAVLIHTVCALVPTAEVNVIVLFGFTVIEPVAVIMPQPPVNVTV